MKKQFLYAKKLNEKYKCYGHFYEINFNSITSMSCRSVLEIVDKSFIPEDISSLAIKIPDVIFVMMNPGSSYPLEPIPTDSKVRASDFLKKKKLVRTRVKIMKLKYKKIQTRILQKLKRFQLTRKKKSSLYEQNKPHCHYHGWKW